MTNPVLFRWPAAATLGLVVAKSKFYEHGNVHAALREKFISDVQRVTWAYKLADATIRLRGTKAVPEIQVFIVETKGGDVSDDVLTAIDKSVHSPIVFEVTGGDRIRTAAAQKALGGRTPVVGTHYSSGWLSADADRRPLPAALDLPGLHDAILSAVLPMTPRAGETVSETAGRLNRAQKLQREITALERKLHTEPQLNRKIELRRTLMSKQTELEEQK
ncbi:DUF4391 domain-containing protein [Microbacterium sp.]|uniref:DUF4391 domain-containing protein n=1 Tax=Microbacterium sp. TaxID=51671 RepID=UPI003C75CB80